MEKSKIFDENIKSYKQVCSDLVITSTLRQIWWLRFSEFILGVETLEQLAKDYRRFWELSSQNVKLSKIELSILMG